MTLDEVNAFLKKIEFANYTLYAIPAIDFDGMIIRTYHWQVNPETGNHAKIFDTGIGIMNHPSMGLVATTVKELLSSSIDERINRAIMKALDDEKSNRRS